jgi:hypothetical protein
MLISGSRGGASIVGAASATAVPICLVGADKQMVAPRKGYK